MSEKPYTTPVWLTHILRSLAIAFSGLVGVGALAGLILAVRLSYGSIDLEFAKKYIEDAFVTEHLYPSFTSLNLTWDSKQHRLFIQSTNVRLSEKGDTKPAVIFPEVGLRYRITDLFALRFIPSEIILYKPHITIYQHAGGYSISAKPTLEPEASLNNINLHDFKDLLSSIKSIEISEGSVDVINMIDGITAHVPDVNLRLARSRDNVSLDANINLPQLPLQLSATADLQPGFSNFNKAAVKIDIKTGAFDYNRVAELWPEKLIPDVRGWLVKNLRDGRVSKTNTFVDFDAIIVNDNKTDFKVHDVHGAIHFNGMTVEYMKDVPLVEKVDGIAKFNKSAFDIDILSGTSSGLKITKGNIKIFGLGVPDQTMEITTHQEGKVQDALKIIDSKPLEILKDADIKLNVTKGNAVTRLFLAFPVEFKLDPKDIVYKVNSTIKDAAINNLLDTKSYKINVTKGDLKLKVDNIKLDIEGKANLNNSPAKVKIEHIIKLDDSHKYKGKYTISTMITNDIIKGFGLPDFMDGVSGFNMDYTKLDDTVSMMDVQVNMTKANFLLPGLANLKPVDQKCSGVARFELHKNRLKRIHTLKFDGDMVKMHLDGQFSDDGFSLTKLSSSNLTIGQTQAGFSMVKKGERYIIDLKGSTLDLEPFLQYKSTDDKESEQPALRINVKMDKVRLAEDKFINNLHGHITSSKGNLTGAELVGQIAGKKPGHTARASLLIDTRGAKSILSAATTSGGELLRLLNIYDSAKGGNMRINAERIDGKQWIGNLKIEDFKVANTPGIAKLASTGFGLFDGLQNEVRFTQFFTKFKLDKNTINLKGGKATGPSLGLSIEGSIDRKNDTLKLHGAVLPYNILNMVLLKIPLVGQLLGGDTGGIWGVSYTTTGPIAKPDTTINPLSALTPGFLRNIFNPEDEYGEDLQEDD